MYIKIYGKKNCPQCDQVKALLESNNLGYEYIDLMSNIEAMQYARKQQWKSVPKVVINGTLIGGYKDVVEFLTKEKS